MRAIAAGVTDVGRERAHNEDRFILLPQFNVFVVADGMGGHQSGEVASRMAASTVAGYFRGKPTANGETASNRLRDALVDANAKIFERADDSRAHRGMGTTVVAAAFSPGDRTMHVAHAGDSRAYLLRDREMKLLTRDHSLLSDALLERPELSESDLSYLPKNVITRALGISPNVELDVNTVSARLGDIFLLCSDGLHGLVEEPEIINIIMKTDSLSDACDRLVEEANAQGGKDNITAVLIRIEEADEPWSARTPMLSSKPPAQRISKAPSETSQGEVKIRDADAADDDDGGRDDGGSDGGADDS